MKKTPLLGLFCYTLLFSQTYNTQGIYTAESKKSACYTALQNAKSEAIEQAGTVVFSNFSTTTSDTMGEISKSNKHELITAALGIAKLKTKSESVQITPEYQFTCKIDATFSIDQGEIKASIEKLIKEQQFEQKFNGYFQAEGFSEEGQSRYRANASAMAIAQRNLLDLIKGSEITSLTKVDKGAIEIDKIGKLLSGTLQGVEIIKQEYNPYTKSSHVVLQIKKSLVAKRLSF